MYAVLPEVFSWPTDTEELSIYRALDRVHTAKDGWPRFKAIREFYSVANPRITQTPCNKWAFDPLAWADGWTVGTSLLTPIEYLFFRESLSRGVVMYPQFPAGRYFLDFANPGPMIAVECDGRRFHTDRERDQRRERGLVDMGWTIHRLTGRELYMVWEPGDNEDDEEVRQSNHENDIPVWNSGEYDPTQSVVLMLSEICGPGANHLYE